MNSIFGKILSSGERTINGETRMVYYLAFYLTMIIYIAYLTSVEWSIPMVISGTKTQHIFIDRVKP